MKLKNLKIYSLVILEIFLLNLKAHAIDIFIDAQLPETFIHNLEKESNKKFIIKEIISSLSAEKSMLSTIFKEISHHINEVEFQIQETIKKGKNVYQCILISYKNKNYFINFQSIKSPK